MRRKKQNKKMKLQSKCLLEFIINELKKYGLQEGCKVVFATEAYYYYIDGIRIILKSNVFNVQNEIVGDIYKLSEIGCPWINFQYYGQYKNQALILVEHASTLGNSRVSHNFSGPYLAVQQTKLDASSFVNEVS